MARQDLFEQRGAGPGQADDENRRAVRASSIAAGFEDIFRKVRRDAGHIRVIVIGAIGDETPFDGVAASVPREGFFEFATVFERFAERKSQMEVVFAADGFASRNRSHGVEVIV